MKKFGKFWEVADFKEIVTNGLNKKMIDFGAFLGGFRLKTPLFLCFLLRSIFDAYALKAYSVINTTKYQPNAAVAE